ncbi:NtaA/DmoA family FMN-dependent monooxygenase [Microbacterium sp. SSW1-59]|uniref:NtaA/DmoA family FMN-dependent monooxygenase n=1 Tax=Microbacterium xanthum TaxID=3079794 RepID=UPI002AD444F6|nr:NtaA/DmoA family FMN-dependent monooxygenase [Microbacterium sp. SSW1-59]MDZ8200491.1 NtaA/DmoA family FMN-dependent monooxygenase [Microbacterium sp. SSW1-59]
MKKLHFGLFENAQANDTGRATWRHPDNTRENFDTLEYWLELARLCEEGGFDFLFLADAWGWAEVDGERPDVASIEGLDLPRLDPFVVASAILAHTTSLGVVMTGSTLLEQPYPFARRMASLDQLSGGRTGWNIVTTGTAETAVKAFGVPMVAHDERYEMADDFVRLVYRLWEGAWEPDALVKDKGGIFADPAKVHSIRHEGPYFRSEGYGNSAYSPQGTPVLFQAGASPAGRAFGGRHGECMFVGGGSVEQLKAHSTAIREAAVEAGRPAESVKVMAEFRCVVADTEEEARRYYDEVLAAQTADVTVASYAWFTGIDLSSYDPETPMTDLRTEMSQSQISRFAGKTVGDVLAGWREHGAGSSAVLGTPETIADRIIELAEGADLDGFLISPVVQPGSTADFVERVMPILRARGALAESTGATLRERLTGSESATLPADHPAARARAVLQAS